MKNDYSKVFAMLRPVKPGLDGMAGFARIEVRSEKGRMSLNAQGMKGGGAAGEKYVAVLIGADGTSAYECGELLPGSRGQSSMLFEFDPQNIGGAPLESYTAAVVAVRLGGKVTPLVAGIFGRHGVSDWEAAVASLGAGAKAAAVDYEAQREEADGLSEGEIAEPDKNKRSASDGEKSAVEEPLPEEAVETVHDDKETDGIAEDLQDVFAIEDSLTPVEKPVRLCVQDLTWQGYAFAMRKLFEEYPEIVPFENANEMLFVKVNMPVRSAGVDHYILGAHAKGDEVDVLCIGVPGVGGMTPPPGLNSATWKDDGNGGYWLTWQDAYMGYPIRYDM